MSHTRVNYYNIPTDGGYPQAREGNRLTDQAHILGDDSMKNQVLFGV